MTRQHRREAIKWLRETATDVLQFGGHYIVIDEHGVRHEWSAEQQSQFFLAWAALMQAVLDKNYRDKHDRTAVRSALTKVIALSQD
jgi:hypothetical protein